MPAAAAAAIPALIGAAGSIAGGLLGKQEPQKTTLPWLNQYPGWLLFSAFSPQGMDAFKKVKPQMYKQLFGKDFDESTFDPYRRIMGDYSAFDYLNSNPYNRPGGPSAAEQGLVNNSLFGLTAPLNLGGATGATRNLDSFMGSLMPRNLYGLTGDARSSGRAPYASDLSATAWSAPSSQSSFPMVPSPYGNTGITGAGMPAGAANMTMADVIAGVQGGGQPRESRASTDPQMVTSAFTNYRVQPLPSSQQPGVPGYMASPATGSLAGISGLTSTGQQQPQQQQQRVFPGTSTLPGYPTGWNPDTQPGQKYVPGRGWVHVNSGADVTWDAGSNTFYYHGQPITEGQYQELAQRGPDAFTTSGYQDMTRDVFASLGGQIPVPTAPTLSTLGRLQLPDAPQLPEFQAPDVGQLAYNTYRQFASGTPGFDDAVRRALNPQIAMPSQTIFQMAEAQRAAGGPMDKYVDAASGAVQRAADQRYNDQAMQLKSQFAGEGSYMSGPMLNALASLAGSNNAEVANVLAQMRLGAAEGESGRIYGAATTQYNNELDRNKTQAAISAQSATQMADTYGRIAQSTGSATAQALSDAYRTQASFLSNNYNTQVGALTSEYGTRANFLSDTYSTGLQGALTQQGLASNQATQRVAQMLQAQGMSFDQAMQIALAQQKNNQDALDALRTSFYQPAGNLLDVLRSFNYGNVTS